MSNTRSFSGQDAVGRVTDTDHTGGGAAAGEAAGVAPGGAAGGGAAGDAAAGASGAAAGDAAGGAAGAAAGSGSVWGAPGGRAVGELLEALSAADRWLARALRLAGELAGSGMVEAAEGLSVDGLLAAAAGMTGADRGMLQTAAQTLSVMPHTVAGFESGQLSWGQVRGIVARCKRRSRADRGEVDRRIGAWLAQGRGSDDPEQLLWAVEAAVAAQRSAAERRRSERRRVEASFFAVQPGFEGACQVYGQLSAEHAAPLLAALDAAAGPPTPNDTNDDRTRHDTDANGDADGDASDDRGRDRDGGRGENGSGDGRGENGGDDGGDGAAAGAGDAAAGDGDAAAGGVGWSSTSRSRAYAAALAEVAGGWLAGGSGRKPKAAITCRIDLAEATRQPDGVVGLRLRGGLPRVTAAAVEALAACGASLRVLLTDGARPLALTPPVATGLPAAVAAAVRARDGGCRSPGCTAPAEHTDLHHAYLPRAAGGGHDPDELIALCRRHHRQTERHGWQLRLHPQSGQVTLERADRRWRTLPHGTGLPPDPGQPHHPTGPGHPPDRDDDDTVPF